MTLHAKLSASGAHRWMNCPGSVAAESGRPDSSSIYAAEGTTAHALAEHCLVNGVAPHSQIGNTFEGIEVDNYMAEYVQHYVDYVKLFSGHHFYEVRVDFSTWVIDGFGTSDAIILDTKKKVIRVIDLKYGKGHQVDAENNKQAMLYALGALNDFGDYCDFETVEIAIVQPRMDHISEWSLSVSDLLAFGEQAKRACALALSPDAKRVPGESQCQWCKAKADCSELAQYTEAAILTRFDDMNATTIRAVNTLTDVQLRQALDAKKLIIGWLDAVEQYVTDKLNNGETFEGYKIVEGRSLRQWRDESEAAQLLEQHYDADKLYQRKFISVAQAEKLVGKKNAAMLAELVVKPSGKPTLAPDTDKRKSLNTSLDDFDVLS